MYETRGAIDKDVLQSICDHRLKRYQKAVLYVVFGGGLAYLVAGFFSRDPFGAFMGGLMALAGAYACFYRPRKWMRIQQSALDANHTDHLTYTVSYADDHVKIRCETNGWNGTLAYSNFTKAVETDELFVLFTFKQEYVVTFKKQLGEYGCGELKKFLQTRLPRRFRW